MDSDTMLVSWATQILQTSVCVPHIYPHGDRKQLSTNPGSTQSLIVDGEAMVVGVDLSPGQDWKGTVDKWAEPFQAHASRFRLQFHLRKDPEDREAFSQETHAAVVTKSAAGVCLVCTASFHLHAIHLHVPLELCITLTITAQQQQLPPAPGHPGPPDAAMQQQQSSREEDEREVRRLLEMHRYRPPRMPARDTVLPVLTISPLKLSSRCRELSPTTSLLTLTVRNLHPTDTLEVLLLTLHANETLKGGGRIYEQGDSDQGSAIGSFAASASYFGEDSVAMSVADGSVAGDRGEVDRGEVYAFERGSDTSQGEVC